MEQKASDSYPADKDNMEFCKNSGIDILALSDGQIRDIAVLGKIWGFLKYYHPAVAKGDYNWDYELFRVLPKILNADSEQQRDVILIDWIEKSGSFKKGGAISKNEDIVFLPDLNWIDSSDFEPKLIKLLRKIQLAERDTTHYYIEMNPSCPIPHFKNENSYTDMSFPDAGYRLLCLFRYWNIINYFSPYKYLTDDNWEEVLIDFIPKFVDAKNEFDYRLTALEMVTKTNDSHAFFYHGNKMFKKFDECNIVPVGIIFLGDTAVVAGFFKNDFEESTALRKGDVILKINNKAIKNIIKEREAYIPASNRGALLRDFASDILQTSEKSLKIEYSNGSMVYQTEVPAYNKYSLSNKFQKPDTCFKLIESNISYLYLGSIKSEYLPDLWEHIENTEGLVIDLRCYPGDYLMYSLGDYLMSDSTAFVKFSYGSIIHPGTFTYGPTLNVGKDNKQYYKGKVAILINELTQSHAEFSAMAYRTAPKAKVFGSPTAGADGNIVDIKLPGGITTTISSLGIYYPDGRETQRIGIMPDVAVRPTIKGIKEGKDEVLEKAMEWIKEK